MIFLPLIPLTPKFLKNKMAEHVEATVVMRTEDDEQVLPQGPGGIQKLLLLQYQMLTHYILDYNILDKKSSARKNKKDTCDSLLALDFCHISTVQQ